MTRFTVLLGSCIGLSLLMNIARAEDGVPIPLPVIEPADPAEQGDGTLSEAAAKAISQGPLPFSDADVAAKAAANRASDEAMQSETPSRCRSVLTHSYPCP
jgi:hypothetical protein